MTRSLSHDAPSFFREATCAETRETTAEIEKGVLAWCELIGIQCFYRACPLDFKTFESFLASDLDKNKKRQFLINHGLAEASAASLFFENLAHSRNSGFSNDRVMQSLGISTVRHEQISSHDIQYFPFLRDASAYSCSKFFSEHSDVNWFNGLDDNEIFCEKSYWVFLKIILTPSANIRKVFDECILDSVVALNVYVHFFSRRNFLKQNLQKNEKFKKWWERLSASDVQLLFHEFSPAINLQQIKSSFQKFSRDMTIVKINNCFSILADLIDLSVDDALVQHQLSNAVGLYVPLKSLRDALLHLCQSFFKDDELCSQKITTFIRKTTNLLNGVESLVFATTDINAIKVKIFLKEMRDAIQCLQKNFIDSDDEFEEIECVEEHADIEFVGKSTPVNLTHIFIQWLRKREDTTNNCLENKMIFLKIFEHVYREYEKSQNTYKAQATSALFSAVSVTSSWISSRVFSTPGLRTPTLTHNFDDIFNRLKEANDPDKFIHVIGELLSFQGNSIESIHTQFVLKLMEQFSREFLAKQCVMRMQDNTHFSKELMRLLSIPVVDANVMEAVKLFIDMMRPTAEPCLNVSQDWVTVERMSKSCTI